MDLKGAVAIVTGSSSGIGAACVKLLASKGCNVVVNYSKSRDQAEAVAAECRALGGDAITVRADVGEDAECRRLVAETVAKWGRLDALVNNAGTTKFVLHPDLDGLSAQDFLDIYKLNTVGPFMMTRAAAPHMKKQGNGAVVNISSVAGVMGVGSSIAYAASKGALNTMTLSLARVLGPEIRVNTVCPGFVQGSWLRNGMGAERYDATLKDLQENTPLRTAGTPEAMAQAVVWFIEGADLVTGEFLIVDAGKHLATAPVLAR